MTRSCRALTRRHLCSSSPQWIAAGLRGNVHALLVRCVLIFRHLSHFLTSAQVMVLCSHFRFEQRLKKKPPEWLHESHREQQGRKVQSIHKLFEVNQNVNRTGRSRSTLMSMLTSLEQVPLTWEKMLHDDIIFSCTPRPPPHPPHPHLSFTSNTPTLNGSRTPV